MGIQYKILPEIEEFIIHYKKENPKTSCRKMEIILKEKFQIKLSKSSINAIIKKAGLSSKVGRKSLKTKPPEIQPEMQPITETESIKPVPITEPQPIIEPTKEPIPETPVLLPKQEPALAPEEEPEPEKQTLELGVYIYKIADLALDGIKYILQFLELPSGNAQTKEDFYNKILQALYNSGTESAAIVMPDEINKSLSLLSRHLPQKLQEAHFIKITLQDNTCFYIDAEFYSTWQTINIPGEFSFNIEWVKRKLANAVGRRMALLSIPLDPAAFGNLLRLSGMGARKIELLGDAGRILHAFEDKDTGRLDFITGAYPLLCEKFVRVLSKQSTSEFKHSPSKREFILEDLDAELTGFARFEDTQVRMISLRDTGTHKVIFALISNIIREKSDAGQIAKEYLESWPEPLFSLDDFEKKTELFNYNIERNLPQYPPAPGAGWEEILVFWKEALWVYVLKHFLPLDCDKYPETAIKERLLDLNANMEKSDDYWQVKVEIPKNYAFRNDLEYLLARLNQKNIAGLDNKRIWFSIG